MLLGPASFLCLAITLASLLTPTFSFPTHIRNSDIDNSPPPPPDKEPALSTSASRNPATLKYQIAGIVAAYLICLCLAAGVIAYGRRQRRKKQASDRNFSMEMVKPVAKPKQPGLPTSPRNDGYKPWVNSSHGHEHKDSQVTVDERVMEQHKARDMDELERLYAAVLLQDEQFTHQAQIGSRTAQSSMYSERAEEVHELNQMGQAVPLSPAAPNNGVAPTPIDENFQATSERSSPPPKSLETSAPPVGLSGHGQTGSKSSHRSRPSQISVRGLPISTPMGSADLRESAAYSDEAPLSPRLYTPGPPPPTPGYKSAAAQAREMDGQRRGKFRLPTALSNLSRNSNATNSTGTLPLRQYYGESLQSAPPTKTTFIDKRENVLHPGPKTGVPFTPYSPYMPYTPLTPVTPRRLVTKEERKRKEKKAAMKVVDEDDLVASDDDMWSTVR